jgi:hypothetical protein
MRQTVYVECAGVIWRFSKRRWIQMLEWVAVGRHASFEEFGTPLARIDANITRLDARLAANLLKRFTRIER